MNIIGEFRHRCRRNGSGASVDVTVDVTGARNASNSNGSRFREIGRVARICPDLRASGRDAPSRSRSRFLRRLVATREVGDEFLEILTLP